MKKKLILFALMVSLFALPMAAYAQTSRVNVLVGSFMPGKGPTYEIAVTIADFLGKNSNLDMTVKSFSGPATILQALGAGKIQIGSSAKAGTAANAYYGFENFKGKPVKSLRAILTLNFLRQTFITTPSTGIKTIPDLKGKKLARYAAIPNEWADALMEVHGIDPKKDVEKVSLSNFIAATREIQRGRLHAAHGSPYNRGTLSIKEQAGRVVLLPIPPDTLSAAMKKYPQYFMGAYTGYIQPGDIAWVDNDKPLPVVEAGHSAYTVTDMDEELVYTYTKTLLDKWQEVRTLGHSLKVFTPDLFLKPLPVPYHSGAIRAFKEKGMWTEEMQKGHQKALSAHN